MKARAFASVGLMAAIGLAAMAVGGLPASAASTVKTFADCSTCPDMIVIPHGAFMMGSPSSEMYRGAETQHRVTIPSFALGKHEVTFAQWDACVADGGCGGFRPDDHGWEGEISLSSG